MIYRLSGRSIDRLEGIDPRLSQVVHEAIEVTKIDFGVTCGLRTEIEQQELVDIGASKTMKSKHLTGHAVDLVAYINGRVCWELNVYDDIAEAMRSSAFNVGLPIRWGAAWNIPDITQWEGSMESAMNHYIDTRRSEGKRPFIDAPHFEINE